MNSPSRINYIQSLNTANTLATISNNQNQRTYLTTQNIFESSLSEELSMFDFTSNSSVIKVTGCKKNFC
jgi:hypothetical protein